MPVNNNYTLELNEDATEVNMIFGSEIFSGHALWNDRVAKVNTEVANNPNQTLWTVDVNYNDIGPRKRPQ